MSQICLTELSTTPDTPSANKVRIFVGNDGILRSIDDLGVVTTYQPNSGMSCFIQYSNSALFTTSSTTGVAIPLDTIRDSNPSTCFTKTSATDFRSDFNGELSLKYSLDAFTSDNDRGYSAIINKNGADLTWTRRRAWGKNNVERSGSACGSFILACAVADIWQIRLISNEGGVVNLPAESSIAILQFIRAV